MTQAYGDTAEKFTTPTRSRSAFASALASEQEYGSEQGPNDENVDPASLVPPGWQAFRDESNRTVYFNKATGVLESCLQDLFKKPKSSEKRQRKLAPLSPPAPHPDVAHSSTSIVASYIVTPGDRVIRSDGEVVDLISSEEEQAEEESETDVDLPTTEDFDYGGHRSSDGDGGRDGDEDSDTRSEPLF
jgi:hypothetical protein